MIFGLVLAAAVVFGYLALISLPSFFGFVQSTYVVTNVEMQTRSIKIDQNKNSTEEAHSPWADAVCKSAAKNMQRQAWCLEALATVYITALWVAVLVGLKKRPQTAKQIMETHKAFTLAQQAKLADDVKNQRLAQLHNAQMADKEGIATVSAINGSGSNPPTAS